jgi:hypothetical protein
MTWLVDVNDYRVGPSDLKRLALARALLATLQDQYPERVAKLIMVKPPWYFSVLFGMLKPFISSATLSKVVWDKGTSAGRYPLLAAEVEPRWLEMVYGGERPTPLFEDGQRYDEGFKPIGHSGIGMIDGGQTTTSYMSQLVDSLLAGGVAKPKVTFL